jgi:poly-gamma-glutamate synthesis protein (capsule biosynthesis protein)
MGDFLWYSSGLYQPYSSRAGILHLTLRGRTVVRQDFVPTVVSSTGQSTVEKGWKQELARHNFDALRGCAGVRAVTGPR